MKNAIRFLLCLGLLSGSGFVHAQVTGKLVEDIWEVALVTDANGKDQKIGYSRYKVTEMERDGVKYLQARRELHLTVGRGQNEALIRAEMGDDESLEGKVIGVYAKIWTGRDEAITISGRLKSKAKDKEFPTGKAMHVKVDGNMPVERMLPWDDEAVGLITELALLREKKVKSGDEFIYRQFQPTMNNILRITVKVGPEEPLKLPTGTRTLLRVEAKPEKVKVPGTNQEIQLPASIQWVDPSSYIPVVTQTELPGVGTFKLLRANKEAALAKNGDLPNLFDAQSISVTKVPNIHAATAITYRITITGKDADTKELLKEDSRQTVEKIEDKTITLHVESIRKPQVVKNPPKVGEEFLKSNHFINSDSPEVQKHAKTAVGSETDPWKKSQRIEKWVRDNMQPVNYTEALATAATVAKTLNGDCTEYAMLTAAMCRAQGIPSRTAMGLVYVEDRKLGPILGFHMWTEVFVEGQWMGLDATIGQGSVGPGHVKITDHHWSKVDGFNPLLPVTGFLLAKPKIEIISSRRPNATKPPAL